MSTPESHHLRNAQIRLDLASERYSEAAAGSLGVTRADLCCLRTLFLEGPLTAGVLSATCGLTTGAVTGILDRLERMGLITRETDPLDRRRVVAQISGARLPALERLFVPNGEPSDGEVLATVLDARAEALVAAAERLDAENPAPNLEPEAGGFVWAPLGNTQRATFEVIGGSMSVQLSGGAPENELFRATFDSELLRVSERDGHVRLEHRTRWSRGRPEATVLLNSRADWSLRQGGGSNELTCKLQGLAVRDIEVKGGSNRLELEFGDLHTRVPARIIGGANQVDDEGAVVL
jgi:DNA-binding MarR family transcriptional regulator